MSKKLVSQRGTKFVFDDGTVMDIIAYREWCISEREKTMNAKTPVEEASVASSGKVKKTPKSKSEGVEVSVEEAAVADKAE